MSHSTLGRIKPSKNARGHHGSVKQRGKNIIHLAVHFAFCPPTHSSFSLTFLSSISPFINLSIHPTTFLPTFLPFVHLCVHPSIHVSILPFVLLSIYSFPPSLLRSFYLSICSSIHSSIPSSVHVAGRFRVTILRWAMCCGNTRRMACCSCCTD